LFITISKNLSIPRGKLDIILAASKASVSSFDIPAFRNEVLGAREDCETETPFIETNRPGVSLALLLDALGGVARERLETPPHRERRLEYFLLRVCFLCRGLLRPFRPLRLVYFFITLV
jgi:hypothetical protein